MTVKTPLPPGDESGMAGNGAAEGAGARAAEGAGAGEVEELRTEGPVELSTGASKELDTGVSEEVETGASEEPAPGLRLLQKKRSILKIKTKKRNSMQQEYEKRLTDA